MAILRVLFLLCAMFALSLTEELKVVEKRGLCGLGWSNYGNRCFKLFTDRKTWSEAEGHCVSQKGHLASIHNAKESQFVGKFVGERTETWIGGGGSSEGFVWYWTDGSKFDYTNWHVWEPNNDGGNEHCITINHIKSGTATGLWNDYACHKRLQFVCAKL